MDAKRPDATDVVTSLVETIGDDGSALCELTSDPFPDGTADCGYDCSFHNCIGLVPLQRTLMQCAL
jgi:hypothetical protein